jgi:hypothetical protein
MTTVGTGGGSRVNTGIGAGLNSAAAAAAAAVGVVMASRMHALILAGSGTVTFPSWHQMTTDTSSDGSSADTSNAPAPRCSGMARPLNLSRIINRIILF